MAPGFSLGRSNIHASLRSSPPHKTRGKPRRRGATGRPPRQVELPSADKNDQHRYHSDDDIPLLEPSTFDPDSSDDESQSSFDSDDTSLPDLAFRNKADYDYSSSSSDDDSSDDDSLPELAFRNRFQTTNPCHGTRIFPRAIEYSCLASIEPTTQDQR